MQVHRALVFLSVALFAGVSPFARVDAGPAVEVTPADNVDEQLYLLYTLRYAYDFSFTDGGDAASITATLRKTRQDANRYLTYLKAKKLDPDLIEMYADLVKAVDLQADFLVRIDRINRDAVMKSDAASARGGHEAGLSVGEAVGGAAAVGASGGTVLLVGLATAGWEWMQHSERMQQLDESKRRDLEDAYRQVERELSEINSRTEARALLLAERHRWGRGETGFANREKENAALTRHMSDSDVPAAIRWIQPLTRQRPRDPLIAMLAVTFQCSEPNSTPSDGLAAAEDCVKIATLVPRGEIYDQDRAVILAYAGRLAESAAFKEMDGRAFGGRANRISTRALEFLDAAAAYAPLTSIDDDGAIRMSRIEALWLAGRAKEAIQFANDEREFLQPMVEYSIVMSALLSNNGMIDEGFRWLDHAVRSQGLNYFAVIKSNPNWEVLRTQKANEFDDLLKVKFVWDVKYGFLNDDILLTNSSAFAIDNVVLRVNIQSGGKSFTPELKLDRLEAGKTYTWSSVISVPGSKADTATATLECDQTR